MKLLGTPDFPSIRAEFKRLNTAHFPGDVLYPLEDVVWLKSPSYFFAGVVEEGTGRLLSYANVLLISSGEYERFLKGEIPEEKLAGGDLFDQKAYMYIISLIVQSEHHTPFLYRSLFKELNHWCREHHTTITHLFSIPTNQKATDILLKADFSETARYHEYPVLTLERTKNKLVHSLLPEFAKNTQPPF